METSSEILIFNFKHCVPVNPKIDFVKKIRNDAARISANLISVCIRARHTNDE